MTYPAPKKIGTFTIAVDHHGWPRWTRITDEKGMFVAILDEEEAQDLHYALTRIVAFLEDARITDRMRGIVA